MSIFASDRLWDEVVFIETPKRFLRVASCRDAILCLRRYWWGCDQLARQTALKACDHALRGLEDPKMARRAFVRAAKEAGFQVRSWT